MFNKCRSNVTERILPSSPSTLLLTRELMLVPATTGLPIVTFTTPLGIIETTVVVAAVVVVVCVVVVAAACVVVVAACVVVALFCCEH